jgi:hypothetical protein
LDKAAALWPKGLTKSREHKIDLLTLNKVLYFVQRESCVEIQSRKQGYGALLLHFLAMSIFIHNFA